MAISNGNFNIQSINSLLISSLKVSISSQSLILVGNEFHNTAPLYKKLIF